MYNKTYIKINIIRYVSLENLSFYDFMVATQDNEFTAAFKTAANYKYETIFALFWV